MLLFKSLFLVVSIVETALTVDHPFPHLEGTTTGPKTVEYAGRVDRLNVSFGPNFRHTSHFFLHHTAVNIALLVFFLVILVAGTVFLLFGDFEFRDASADFVHNPSILLYAIQLRQYERLLDSDIYKNVIDHIRVQGFYQPYSFGRIVRDYTLTMRSVSNSPDLSKKLNGGATIKGKDGSRKSHRKDRNKASLGVRQRKAGKTAFQLANQSHEDEAKREGEQFFKRLLEMSKHVPQLLSAKHPPTDAELAKKLK
ncbi:hypothetical protein L596_012300 [Steinernema carpocapsae]|uniref:Uncharacterized protein n=1 Tax=Steinernema carpocapsae TaxID=34508 RepID=A0A4U5NWV8_STECR|nr:hypothetical protein L596_012300 [Steinernema carpocapsae]